MKVANSQNQSWRSQMRGVSIFALALAVSAFPAVAQDLTSDQAPVKNEEPMVLNEIVVTAQRRYENIQDIPIAIVALGSQPLENNAPFDSVDL